MKNITVIGSGVMGSGIAAQIANSGMKVHLLDIVPNEAKDKNILAKQAIEKLASSLEDRTELIVPGNLKDDIDKIKSADWIIEVIIEKLEFKQQLYKKLEQYCKPDAIISSNTSTIPLKDLINGMSDNFKQKFLITHFFNPPRYMQLLELVTSNFTNKEIIKTISHFLDIQLGKTVVVSNDTPGFIANRIGCYWLETALTTAIEMKIPVEEADSLMGKPLGIPSTAIFGLYDLIGIDVMRLISKSLSNSLSQSDDFLKVSKEWPLITKMIEDGFIGRKGKGGFYKIAKDASGNKIKEVINLQTGQYQQSKEVIAPSTTIKELIENNDYAARVLGKTLSYAASLVNEVSDKLCDIDTAMKLGYNWKYGPFELIDLIGVEVLRAQLIKQNIQIPKILEKVGNNKFYNQEMYFTGSNYLAIPRGEGIILLKDYKNKAPISSNDSVNIWDIGDGIAAIEITTKMAILNHEVFHSVIKFLENDASNYKGIVIANEQSNFSVGGDLKFMLEMAEKKNFKAIDDYLKLGQEMMLKLKYSSIPVISALKGMAFGGGCEILLHSAAVASHVEANIGLVETGVGIVPAWGGCKEAIIRAKTTEEKITAFKNILHGKVFSSAHSFSEFKIIMNPNRVLAEAKNLCIQMSKGYKILQNTNSISLNIDWTQVISEEKIEGYNKIIADELASIFSLNAADENILLDKEREVFIRLLHNKPTIDRISYMLKHGKRLAN